MSRSLPPATGAFLVCICLFAASPVFAEVVPVRPALHWAAANGLLDTASLLIEEGAEVNETDHFGNTPLHLAFRYPEMVRLLLDSGAEVNAKNAFGNTPLHLAVEDKAVVEILIAAGADVNLVNGFDKTPLDYAMRGGTSEYNLSIVETLIRAGAR